MTIKDVRKANLGKLLNTKCGGVLVNLSKLTGIYSSNLSNYLSENENVAVSISNGTARKIEKNVGLPVLWLDIDHDKYEENRPEMWNTLSSAQRQETESYISYLLYRDC